LDIAVLGQVYPDSFARCILAGLAELGHHAWAVDRAPLTSATNVRFTRLGRLLTAASELRPLEQLEDRLASRALLAQSPELVIVTGKSLQPRTIARLRRTLGVPIVYWFPDHLANLGRQYPLVGSYDALFFKDPYIVEFATRKLRLTAYYLPEACFPRWHRRVNLSPEDQARYGCDLTLAGNMYVYRARLLEPLATYDLRIWGSQFPSWLDSPLRSRYPNVYVAEEEKAKAFNAAKIVLNTMHYGEIWGVNARTFEASGCGAFQIAESRPRLPDLFEPGREIETFESADELKEKVDYYLSHPVQRRAIADAGYARAHGEHTYAHRLERLLSLTYGSTRLVRGS
jgi:spore maturation protein CgeB